MIILSKYKLIPDKVNGNKRRVKSEEKSICPICLSEALKVIGSRNRSAINSKGENLIIVIRRLKCRFCKKIHHELPDILVPYKRYLSKCIEAILDGQGDRISCENSSIYRLNQWFKGIGIHIKRSLASTATRMNVKIKSGGEPILKAIKAYVGEAPGWLARVVRIVINTNNWVHTRYAFMA
ncbi:MAG: DUF6431 domain-containing protein [Parabacteroides sp.]|nr:DUF6431 domain-containing protein [Parabacteroides sp.]